jgi:hypothetical protein
VSIAMPRVTCAEDVAALEKVWPPEVLMVPAWELIFGTCLISLAGSRTTSAGCIAGDDVGVLGVGLVSDRVLVQALYSQRIFFSLHLSQRSLFILVHWARAM